MAPSRTRGSQAIKVKVLREASGPRLNKGDTVWVWYAGTLTDGSPFDANYNFSSFEPAPQRTLFNFQLGSGQVIAGWEQLQGRRLGEVLDLTIPANLAYGSAGSPPRIPANATLRFRVELVAAQAPGAQQASFANLKQLGVNTKALKLKTRDLDGLEASKVGLDRADQLNGSETRDLLLGLKGNDRLAGGGGPDLLIGGEGRDQFIYSALSESIPQAPDRILDLAKGDRIDLRGLGGSLRYIAAKPFSGTSGEVRFSAGLLELDSDGDRQSDFAIALANTKSLGASSLML